MVLGRQQRRVLRRRHFRREKIPHGPVHVDGVTGAVAVSASYYAQCAITDAGVARCWGDRFASVPVTAARNVAEASGGVEFFCFRRVDGSIGCLGNDADGQLGDGPTDSTGSMVVDVTGIDSARALAAGDSHACAIVADGNVWCWGLNDRGQLGDGTRSSSNAPIMVEPP